MTDRGLTATVVTLLVRRSDVSTISPDHLPGNMRT